MYIFSDNACTKKDLHTPEEPQEKNDESSEHASSSSCSKSSKSGGNDFSSDEAKESEGDSDPVVEHTSDKKQESEVVGNTVNSSSGNTEGPEQSQVIENNKPNTVIVKFSCDICNISVNSSTQLSQVSTHLSCSVANCR